MLNRSADIIQQSIFNKSLKDKFILVLNLPNCIKDLQVNKLETSGLVNLDALQFSIYSAPAPSINIPHIPQNVSGQVYNVTSQFREAYSPMKVNFTIDTLYGNYYVLWKWLSMINDPKNSGMNEYFRKETRPEAIFDRYLDYQTLITVYALDGYNKKVAKWSYTNCFPVYLGEISYNYRLPEEAECSFDFVYNQIDFTLITEDGQE